MPASFRAHFFFEMPGILRNMSSTRRSPISAWNLRSMKTRKMTPAMIAVAVKMMAFPVVSRAIRFGAA
jgi:hypothetical protein